MHDPTTLARSIWWPIPRVSKNKHLGGRGDKRFGWTVRVWPFAHHTYFSPFVYLFGYELYFSEMVAIWHTDPKGDAGPACHGRKHWKWHIHHMSVKFPIWYTFLQKYVTKCAWCGKKSSKELGRVNHSDGRTVYHAKCSSEQHKAYHAHDPRGCYACSGKASFEFNRTRVLPAIKPDMPLAQRKCLSSLHIMVDLKQMSYRAAVEQYQRKKLKAAKWL